MTAGRAGRDGAAAGGGLVAAGRAGRDGAAAPPAAGAGPAASARAGLAEAPGGRSRSRYQVAFFLLAALGLAGAAAYALLGPQLLVVRSVQVTGTHLVPESEVLAAAAIPPGLPLIRVDTGAAASRVDRITQVQSAQVTRSWPDRVVIAVRERTPALAVPVTGGFDLVDPTGVVVRQVQNRPRGLPRFVPAGPLAGNPGIRAAAAVLRQLPPGISRRVQAVTVPTLDAVTLQLSGGVTVDWGSSGQAAQKARVLAILLRTHARSYDVSAPGTAATG